MRFTYIPRYAVADYNRWEGDWELIDGIPHAMSPSPFRLHRILQAEIVRQIGNSLREKKESNAAIAVVSDLDWVIDDNTVLRPDVAIICNEKENFITSPPKLIIEILSASTALKDRHVKFDIYQEQRVKYYIIIDPETEKFTIYRLTDGRYNEENSVTSFTIHDNCAIELDIAEVLAEVK